MSPQQELNVKLLELKDLLSDMKALLEWQKLKVYENTHNPSLRLFFGDDAVHQLADKYALFLSVSTQISQCLKNQGRSVKRSQLAKELHKLCAQFYYLGTDVRVY